VALGKRIFHCNTREAHLRARHRGTDTEESLIDEDDISSYFVPLLRPISTRSKTLTFLRFPRTISSFSSSFRGHQRRPQRSVRMASDIIATFGPAWSISAYSDRLPQDFHPIDRRRQAGRHLKEAEIPETSRVCSK
jgi:hypothetical protein